jgi:hypothetical protein
VTADGQTTLFVYDGDGRGAKRSTPERSERGNLVKKIRPDGSRTIYVGKVYEVEKASGGTVIAIPIATE